MSFFVLGSLTYFVGYKRISLSWRRLRSCVASLECFYLTSSWLPQHLPCVINVKGDYPWCWLEENLRESLCFLQDPFSWQSKRNNLHVWQDEAAFWSGAAREILLPEPTPERMRLFWPRREMKGVYWWNTFWQMAFGSHSRCGHATHNAH